MNTCYKVYLALVILSTVNAKPSAVTNDRTKLATSLTTENSNDQNLFPAVTESISIKNDRTLINSEIIKKRSVEDLETAAGSNVLRPLFVYRQQLAYREKIKKGVAKRAGFRPGF